MPPARLETSVVEDLAWLGDVHEVHHPITPNHPVFVRDQVFEAIPGAPAPTTPYPEQHPHCEFSFSFRGRSLQFIAGEKMERGDGDLMIMGPGTPHRSIRLSHPTRATNVHFLPILLLQMGPEADGVRMLSRFTVPTKIADRIVRPPPRVRDKLAELFDEMVLEFAQQRVGTEFRLRTLLMESLVQFARWEDAGGRRFHSELEGPNWHQIEKTLRFIHEHYADPLYVGDIACAAGVSVDRLQTIFPQALGTTCLQYLKTYRIAHAKALLCKPDARVAEVALQVGFDTLSHFNNSFRVAVGTSPTEYIHSLRR